MERFGIRLQLGSTPYAAGQMPTKLDALLARLALADCESPEAADAAYRELPLEWRDGIPMASEAIMEYPAIPLRPKLIRRSLEIFFKRNPDVGSRIAPLAGKRGHRYPALNKPKANLANIEATLDLWQTPALWFFCTGDQKKIDDLLGHCSHIGKKRTTGFGEVEKIDFFDCHNDLCGLFDRQGRPTRPIPMDSWERLKPKSARDYSAVYESIRPPYWQTEKVFCMAGLPDQRVRTRTAIVEDLLG